MKPKAVSSKQKLKIREDFSQINQEKERRHQLLKTGIKERISLNWWVHAYLELLNLLDELNLLSVCKFPLCLW